MQLSCFVELQTQIYMRIPVKEFVAYARDHYPLNDPILDVCAGWEPNFYQPLFPGRVYLKQDQVQFDPPTIDYVCDAHNMEPIKDNSIGTVLFLEALEHLQEPQIVVNEIYRMLRPGGICVATTLMTFEIHRTPYDYWRFCPDGICYLFRFFNLLEIVLEHHRTLPRGIWCIARKPENIKVDDASMLSVLPKVRVHESGKSKFKNLIKAALKNLGVDIFRVSRNSDSVEVIGKRNGNIWKGKLR
jgi:SAM-dependent methyltransferase